MILLSPGGYRTFPPSSAHIIRQPTVNFPRERSQSDSREVGLWPNLPEHYFGVDRQLPEWLLQPWLLLQEAAQRKRPLAERLAAAKVAQALTISLLSMCLPMLLGLRAKRQRDCQSQNICRNG